MANRKHHVIKVLGVNRVNVYISDYGTMGSGVHVKFTEVKKQAISFSTREQAKLIGNTLVDLQEISGFKVVKAKEAKVYYPYMSLKTESLLS